MSDRLSFGCFSGAAGRCFPHLVWPCISGVASFLIRVTFVLAMVAFLGSVVPGLLAGAALSPGHAAFWGGFGGIIAAVAAIMHAACRLKLCRGCVEDVIGAESGRPWLTDLAAVLVTDIVFGILHGLGVAALVLSLLSMTVCPGFGNSALFVLGCLAVPAAGGLHRICLMSYLMHGGNILSSMRDGCREVVRHPFYTAGMLIFPFLLGIAMEMALFISLTGGALYGMLLSGFGILASSWLEPVLWGVLLDHGVDA